MCRGNTAVVLKRKSTKKCINVLNFSTLLEREKYNNKSTPTILNARILQSSLNFPFSFVLYLYQAILLAVVVVVVVAFICKGNCSGV